MGQALLRSNCCAALASFRVRSSSCCGHLLVVFQTACQSGSPVVAADSRVGLQFWSPLCNYRMSVPGWRWDLRFHGLLRRDS